MVILTEEEKQEMCIELADHLPKIRELLKLSQKAFGERCRYFNTQDVCDRK